jgi:hypothetical protein
METIALQSEKKSVNAKVWTGRIISILCVLFLLMDSVMKIMMNHFHIEGSAKLGFAPEHVQPIGIILFVCTVLYCIPRTAIIGAVFLTGYFGGAIASMYRVGELFYFPVVYAILIWGSLYLRDEKLRSVVAIIRKGK